MGKFNWCFAFVFEPIDYMMIFQEMCNILLFFDRVKKNFGAIQDDNNENKEVMIDVLVNNEKKKILF